MKRFVVIVTSLLIIFVFIALNYLLWDRESLVTLGESKQASIDALSRINMTLSEDKNRLEQRNEELNSQLKSQEDKIKALETDIFNQQILIDDKTQFIMELKTQINPEPIQTATMGWIEALSEKSYSAAFIKSGSSCRFWGNIWSLRIFTDFFDKNVKQIQLFQLDENNLIAIEIFPSDTPDWEMIVLLHVDIVLTEDSDQEYLASGENVLRFTYTYSDRLEQWQISSIENEKAENQEDTEQLTEDEQPQDMAG